MPRRPPCASKATRGATITSSWRAVRQRRGCAMGSGMPKPLARIGVSGPNGAKRSVAPVITGRKTVRPRCQACRARGMQSSSPAVGRYSARLRARFTAGSDHSRWTARREAARASLSGNARRFARIARRRRPFPTGSSPARSVVWSLVGFVDMSLVGPLVGPEGWSLPPVPVQPVALRPRASGGTKSGRAGFPSWTLVPSGHAQTAGSTRSRKRD